MGNEPERPQEALQRPEGGSKRREKKWSRVSVSDPNRGNDSQPLMREQAAAQSGTVPVLTNRGTYHWHNSEWMTLAPWSMARGDDEP